MDIKENPKEKFRLVSKLLSDLNLEYSKIKEEEKNILSQKNKITKLCTHNFVLYPFEHSGESYAYCLSCKAEVKIDENTMSNVNVINLKDILRKNNIKEIDINYDLLFSEVFERISECFSDFLTKENEEDDDLIISLVEKKIQEIVKDFCYSEAANIGKKG